MFTLPDMTWANNTHKNCAFPFVHVHDNTLLPGAYDNAWGLSFPVCQSFKLVVSHSSYNVCDDVSGMVNCSSKSCSSCFSSLL